MNGRLIGGQGAARFTRVSPLILMAMLAGCNTSGFKGNSRLIKPAPQPVPKEQTLVAMGMEEQVDGGQVQMATIDDLKVVFQAGDRRIVGQDTSTVRQAVDLYFVLDTTASMTDEMRAVKNGITGLVSELRRSGLDLNVGLVGFVDSFTATEARVFRTSNNYLGFQTFVSSITPTGNDDYPEAALHGARRAVELLKSSSRQGSFKAIVLVTDVVGHNGSQTGGGKPARDCSILALVNDINSYAATLPRMDDFKFFYTVPDPARVAFNEENYGAFLNCQSQEDRNGYVAIRQMEDIVSNILPAVDPNSRGGALRDAAGNVAWPLTQNNLVTTLVPMLQNNPVTRNILGSCLARSASIFEGSDRVSGWQPANGAEALRALDGGDNTLSIPSAITRNSVVGNRSFELVVERCCVSADDLKAGRTDVCKSSYQQRIPFTVNQTPPRA
ncbi:MAG: hypothetical protein RIQ81_94 [Pseudomonadota bacterium]|jgi:hypothetical protein